MTRYGTLGDVIRQHAQTDMEADRPFAWMDDALCREVGIDTFFPDTGDAATAHRAKEVCADCPVQTMCLQYALDNKISDGIFGGLSPKERVRLNSDQGYRYVCRRCGKEGRASTKSRRHYCSDNCRKQDGNQRRRNPGSCGDCGGPTSDIKYTRCSRCASTRSVLAIAKKAAA